MPRKKSPLTDDDRALWKAVSSVIEPHKKTDAHRKKRLFKSDEEPPPPAQKKKTWQAVAHQPASFAPPKKQTQDLPAIPADIARRIKTKKRGVDARLDLHGMTQAIAHRKVLAFIHSCAMRGLKTVLVITGKGSASGSEGILQKNLPRWLSADASTASHISSISPAPRELGGDGAFVVMLKRQR